MPRHPFHIVDPSPWPAVTTVGAMSLVMGLVAFFREGTVLCLGLGFVQLAMSWGGWLRDVVREGTYLGHHTSYVVRGLRGGFLLFLGSEVMFFVGVFWAFFHSALSPGPEIGCTWPPVGVEVIDSFSVPLANTVVLVASGVSLTFAHHSVMVGRMHGGGMGLFWTVLLGGFFMYLQYSEYYDAPFSMADGIYGSIFYFATGFHGLHVIIGVVFLFIMGLRLLNHHFATDRHLGLELGSWYWHFVDVVWILLYFCVYRWGC